MGSVAAWVAFSEEGSCCPSPSQAALSLGTHIGTQVPAHPNNVRPLARPGQCLASPAQSPAGSPPHSPQGPLNLDVYGVLPSVPWLLASARRRRGLRSSTGDLARLGWEVKGTGQISISNQVQMRSWEPSQPVPSKPSLGPRPAQAQDPTKVHPPVLLPPVPQSPVSSLRVPRARQGAKQVGEQASKLWPVYECVCVRVCPPACLP